MTKPNMQGGGGGRAEIYGLYDPRDGALRYIGKANNSAKRLASHLRDYKRRDTPVYRWMRKLSAMGLTPTLRVIVVTKDWKSEEREQIKAARDRGERILNVAEGGTEPFCPAEVRAANGRANAQKRDKRLWSLKRTLGDSLKRGYGSEEIRARIRARPDVFGKLATIA